MDTGFGFLTTTYRPSGATRAVASRLRYLRRLRLGDRVVLAALAAAVVIAALAAEVVVVAGLERQSLAAAARAWTAETSLTGSSLALADQRTAMQEYLLARGPQPLERYRASREAAVRASGDVAARAERAGVDSGSLLAAVRAWEAWADATAALPPDQVGQADLERGDRLYGAIVAEEARVGKRLAADTDALKIESQRRLALLTWAATAAGLLLVGMLGFAWWLARAATALPARAATSGELAAANRHRLDMLASLSHELRTPVNVIVGLSSVLLDSDLRRMDPDRLTRLVGHIHDSGERLLDLTTDVLDLARAEAGRLEVRAEDVDVAAAVSLVVETMKPLADQEGIDLDASLHVHLQVRADREMVQHMLLNLVSNAIKFTPRDGRVTVTASRRPGRVVIAVADTGIGIAQQDQERIFEEFHQVHPGAGGRRLGSGLGLALTRRWAELHGGRVWVESELGRGSTFFLELPDAIPSTHGMVDPAADRPFSRPGMGDPATDRPLRSATGAR